MNAEALERAPSWGLTESELRRRLRERYQEHTSVRAAADASSAFLLVRTFAMIALGVIAIAAGGPIGIVAGFLLIGVGQYHLSVAIHEACHFGLFGNKRTNESVGALIGWTIGLGLGAYREHHWAHHRDYGLREDADFPLYGEPYATAGEMARDMAWKFTLLGLVKRVASRVLERGGSEDGAPTTNAYANPIAFGGAQLVILAAFSWGIGWWAYAVGWFLPLLVFPALFNGLRMFGEHGGLTGGSRFQIHRARSTLCEEGAFRRPLAALERFALAPFHFNLHHEHHLFPQMPYHKLPELHRALRADGYYAAHPDLVSGSYLATFRKVLEAPSAASGSEEA